MRKLTYKGLRKKAWELQSRAIRKEEKYRCCTCWKIYSKDETQLGHFIHGDSMDFVRDNLHCQCVKCNHFLSGNLINYTMFMLEKYGKEKVDELRKLKWMPHRYTIKELEAIIKMYEKPKK